MTEQERALVRDLARCRFLPGSGPKRFVRALAYLAAREGGEGLTDAQRAYLWSLAWSYRRQLPARWADVAAARTGRTDRPFKAQQARDAARRAQLPLFR